MSEWEGLRISMEVASQSELGEFREELTTLRPSGDPDPDFFPPFVQQSGGS